MRGPEVSWSPQDVVGTYTVPQCNRPFQACYRGPEGPSYVCMESTSKLVDALDSSAPP